MYIGSLSLTLALMIQYVAIFVKLVTHMSRNLELAQYYDLKKAVFSFEEAVLLVPCTLLWMVCLTGWPLASTSTQRRASLRRWIHTISKEIASRNR